MKKRRYFIGIVVLLLVVLLLVSQVLLSARIKKGIIDWCNHHGVESSDFNCRVNFLARNIGLRGLTFKKEENNFRIERVNISFYLLDFLSKRNIRFVHIDKADVILKHFLPFYLPSTTKDTNNNPGNPIKNPFLVDELKIDNLILRIELPGGGKIQDINLEGLFRNMGANRNATFSVKAILNSSSLKITGDFNFSDWKKRLAYQLLGEDVSLDTLNILEEGFLPSGVREQLLSLYFKNALQIKLRGKLDITGEGQIKEQVIDSKLKFVVSDLSCETENENLKSLINRISSKGDLEIAYKIYGTLKNPYLTYDISF